MTNRELEELGKKYYKDRSYKEAAETLSKVKDKTEPSMVILVKSLIKLGWRGAPQELFNIL